MRRLLMYSVALAALLGVAGVAQADNQEKLGNMQATGTTSSAFNYVPQTGEFADQLKENLKKIKLPPGFKINLYAVVPDARHMAVGPQGVVKPELPSQREQTRDARRQRGVLRSPDGI